MKKIVVIFFTGALMIMVASCGGSKENKETSPQAPAENVEVVSETIDAETALADYEKYVNEYVDIIKKMQAGDTKVISDYSEYSQQTQQMTADMERYRIDFSPDQMKRWETSQTKLAAAIKSLSEKK